VACANGTSSQNGICGCGAETNQCNNACVDVLTDPRNCGGCGKACMPGQSCQNGTCG
jgi:hypothetical protein